MTTTDPRTVAHGLRPLVSRLYYVLRRSSPAFDLTLTQSQVMSALLVASPQRMGTLAAREGVALPTMTDVVRRLEGLGHVSRRRDPEDGRGVLVALAPAGADLLAQVVADREEVLAESLAALDDADRAAIAAALPALGRLLATRTDTPTDIPAGGTSHVR